MVFPTLWGLNEAWMIFFSKMKNISNAYERISHEFTNLLYFCIIETQIHINNMVICVHIAYMLMVVHRRDDDVSHASVAAFNALDGGSLIRLC